MPSELPLALQTLYAELLERVVAADFQASFPSNGTFVAKTIRGRRYWYFQDTVLAGRKQSYVGPETPELLQRIARHKEVAEHQNDLRALVSTLVRSARLPRPPASIGTLVAAMAAAGVFRLRGVLVGTVAYQTYPAMLGERLPGSLVQTQDIDIAQFTDVSIAVEDRTTPISEVLMHADRSLRPIPHVAGARYVTAFTASNGVRVEFLTPNRGPDSDKPRRLPAFGVDAQPLRFLDYLIRDPEPAVLLHGAGIHVLVPAPQRFALHKLILARRRSIGEAKSEKDIRQAASLLDVLIRNRPHELCEAWQEAWACGAAWRRLLGEGLGMVRPDIRDRTLQLVGAPRSTIPGLGLQFHAPAIGYDDTRGIAFCFGKAGVETIRCAVTREALADQLGASGAVRHDWIEAFRKHRPMLERMLRTKYLSWPVEEPSSVLIRADDVAELQRPSRRPA